MKDGLFYLYVTYWRSLAVINTMAKDNLGGKKGLFRLTFQSVIKEIQGRNLHSEIELETMEERLLTALSP